MVGVANARGRRVSGVTGLRRGSVARDEAGSSSDVDVLVGFRGTPDFDRFMDLKLFLEEHLGARVDLVTTSALRPRLRAGVDLDAINVP